MARIEAELAGTPVSPPIINLLYSSPALPAYPEIGQAIASGATEEAIRELVLKLHDPQNITYKLVPGLYAREEVPAECIVELQGLHFSFPPELQLAIDHGVLDAEGDALVLRDREGTVVMPPSFVGQPNDDA